MDNFSDTTDQSSGENPPDFGNPPTIQELYNNSRYFKAVDETDKQTSLLSAKKSKPKKKSAVSFKTTTRRNRVLERALKRHRPVRTYKSWTDSSSDTICTESSESDTIVNTERTRKCRCIFTICNRTGTIDYRFVWSEETLRRQYPEFSFPPWGWVNSAVLQTALMRIEGPSRNFSQIALNGEEMTGSDPDIYYEF